MGSRVLTAAFLLVTWCACMAAQAPQRANLSTNPAVEKALSTGEAALKAGRFKDALAAFTRASDLEKQQSAAAFYGISRAHRGLRDHKREAETAIAGINLAVEMGREDSRLAGQLYNQLGMAYASQATKPADQELEDAVQAFVTALQLSDSIPIAIFNAGVTLLQQGRDEVGREALEEFLATAPKAPEAGLAKKYLANPQLARDEFARRVKKLPR